MNLPLLDWLLKAVGVVAELPNILDVEFQGKVKEMQAPYRRAAPGSRVISNLVATALLTYVAFFTIWFSLPSDPSDCRCDFSSFLASGQAANEGRDPYGVYEGTGVAYGIPSPNLNPPVSVIPFSLLAHLEPKVAYWLWWLGSCVAYFFAVLLLVRAYPERTRPILIVWVLSLAPFWSTLAIGQVYLPLLLACVGAWLSLRDNRTVAAGIFIGAVVAIKPNFAIWIALLLLARYYVPALAAIASTAAISVVPALLYGPTIYVQWAETAAHYPGLWMPTNASLPGLTARLGVPIAGYWLGAGLLLALGVWAWRNRPAELRLSAFAIVASLLASPIAWLGYLSLLLPIFWSRDWRWPLAMAAGLLAFPLALAGPIALRWQQGFVVFSSLHNIALLMVFAALVAEG